MNLEELFEGAKKDVALRQPYLDAVHRLCPAEVSGICYDPTGKKIMTRAEELYEKEWMSKKGLEQIKATLPPGEQIIASVLLPRDSIGRGDKEAIFVHPCFFEDLYFLPGGHSGMTNILLNHEVVHVLQRVHGIQWDDVSFDYQQATSIPLDLFHHAVETLAHTNELSCAEEKGLTKVWSYFNTQLSLQAIGKRMKYYTTKSALEEKLATKIRKACEPYTNISFNPHHNETF